MFFNSIPMLSGTMSVRISCLLFIVLVFPVALFGQETVDSSTQIEICFSAEHSYVSDLGFYLIGPQECGSPIVALAPVASSVDPTSGCCCNQGNDVNALCFSTSGDSIFDLCQSTVPLTGSYFGYGTANVGDSAIDWSSLIGCPIVSGSWRAQIFDCVGADVGFMTGASLEVNGSTDEYLFPIDTLTSAINDNSCDHITASIVQFGTDSILTHSMILNDQQLLTYQFYEGTSQLVIKGDIHTGLIMDLYDIRGRLLETREIQQNQPIDLSKNRGVVIMIVNDDAGVPLLTIKLILP